MSTNLEELGEQFILVGRSLPVVMQVGTVPLPVLTCINWCTSSAPPPGREQCGYGHLSQAP